MNRVHARAALQQISLGAGLTLIVGLLTLLFSFLGTITCAVLGGMISATLPKRGWQTVWISLIFPGVIMAFMVGEKTYLSPRQRVLLALLCFGAYWITFLLAHLLFSLERKEEQGAAESVGERVKAAVTTRPEPEMEDEAAVGTGQGAKLTQDAPTSEAERPKEGGIEEFLGRWERRAVNGEGRTETRVIEITGERVAWSTLDAQGQVCLKIQGGARFERLGPFMTLQIVDPKADPGTAATDPVLCHATWLCKVADQRLTIVSNFEMHRGDLEPLVDTYLQRRD